jgi:GR25 family glycosyltransferase involved in LPS biosynthesis
MRLIRFLAVATYNLFVAVLMLSPIIFGKNIILCVTLPLCVPLFFCRLFRNSYGTCVDFKESNNGKIVAYFLNLDRASERLAYILPQISELNIPFERISAVDGASLSEHEVKSIADIECYKRYFKMSPEPGTIGCSLSHKIAWDRFLESDSEFALIFEDDVKFDPDELRRVVRLLMQKKGLWDLVALELNHNGSPAKIFPLFRDKFLVIYLTNIKHSGCYLINRVTAKKLIEKFYPIKMPLDHYFTAAWEFDIKFTGIESRIVNQQFGNSQIKFSSTKTNSPIYLITNAIYNIKRSATHTVYNFYCFLRAKFKHMSE